MPLKKARAKNYANLEYFRFCAFFRGFLLLTFVRGISESDRKLKVLKKSVFWAKLFLGSLFTKVICTFLKSV
jgi:hypothetical protein